jgi:hypothetical protein
MRYLVIFLASAILLPGSISAQKAAPEISPLDKISRSFSDDKLGRTTMPKGAKLMENELNNSECSPQKLADCYVRDVNGVELYFSPYDGLNSKEITIDAGSSGALSVLGIGKARSKKDVLAAVTRFVPKITFECAAAYETNGPRPCVAQIPKKMGSKALPSQQDPSTVELVFNRDDRITSVLVRRSNFID